MCGAVDAVPREAKGHESAKGHRHPKRRARWARPTFPEGPPRNVVGLENAKAPATTETPPDAGRDLRVLRGPALRALRVPQKNCPGAGGGAHGVSALLSGRLQPTRNLIRISYRLDPGPAQEPPGRQKAPPRFSRERGSGAWVKERELEAPATLRAYFFLDLAGAALAAARFSSTAAWAAARRATGTR